MATRVKTVEYAFPTNTTSVAGGVRHDHAAITLYIPEGSVVFKSVAMHYHCSDYITVASSPTSWLMGIKLAAIAFSDVTVTDTITDSGESQSFIFVRDITSYFTTNWTGTSMTCQVGFTLGTTTSNNHTCKLLITYEYDDTSTTHVKTIRIPIESTRALLTTSQQTVGGTGALLAWNTGELPEASVAVRQVFLELFADGGVIAAGNFTARARYGVAGTTYTWYSQEATLNASNWCYGIADLTSEVGLVNTDLYCDVTTTTNRIANCGGVLVITYEFNATNTSTVLNSVKISGPGSPSIISSSVGIGNGDAATVDYYIPESGTISLLPSALLTFLSQEDGINLSVRCGLQPHKSYALLANTIQAGQTSLVHRIDASGQLSTAFGTLARGKNELPFSWEVDVNNQGSAMTSFILLNYLSTKAASGVAVHNKTVYKLQQGTQADDIQETLGPITALDIPESGTGYYVNSVLSYTSSISDNSISPGFAGEAERQIGEGAGSGWQPFYILTGRDDSENYLNTFYNSIPNVWQRWPDDTDTKRLEVTAGRIWRVDSTARAWSSLSHFVTYHSMQFTVSGMITGSNGGTINVDIFKAVTGEKIGNTSRVGDGLYTLPWYDNTEQLFAAAREDATHVGRSDNGLAI